MNDTTAQRQHMGTELENEAPAEIHVLGMTAWDAITIDKNDIHTTIWGTRVVVKCLRPRGRVYFDQHVPGSRLQVLMVAIHEGDKALAHEAKLAAKRKPRETKPPGRYWSDRLGWVTIPQN